MRDPFTWVSTLAFALILLGVWGVNRFAAKE
jgi:C1A family cysteine protease